jgi:acetyl-CoA carboxylase biotin carboxylase subunit
MFNKILIANRGEIALRILRACRQLGVSSVVVYSEADRDSLPVRLADEAVCIGPASAQKSYLNIPNIVSAARITGCEAIHPGYGFLAENPYLAEICNSYDITFIGPPAQLMEQMADKALTRHLMSEAGLPVLPGTKRPLRNATEAQNLAGKMGYPVLLKAAFGGGGRGLGLVRSDEELLRIYPVLRAEAENSFGKPALYLEKYLENARHIEFQILADNFGKVVHLAERDCSLQRRSQKMIEESPAPGITSDIRNKLGKAVAKATASLGYRGAGTAEFLMDEAGDFYFIEMNSRIQVEHPVTEIITGVDIVQWQLRLASGERLDWEASDPNGHSFECRITAEDPNNGLKPQVGTIDTLLFPGGPGLRVDSHLFPGFRIEPFYDSLLAKIISWGKDRKSALTRMRNALSEVVISGVKTNLSLLQDLLEHPSVIKGKVTTDFLEKHLDRAYNSAENPSASEEGAPSPN